MTQLEKVHKLAEILDMKKATDIIALNLNGATIVADYFVICTARSNPQMHALFEAASEGMLALGCEIDHSEGTRNPDWALIDFGGVVLHIFSSQMRDFYGLDNLWADATKVDIKTIDEI